MPRNVVNTSAPWFHREPVTIRLRRSSRPVIVALDGGLDAERAIPFAKALAQRWGAPLRLLHVRNPVDESFGLDLCMVDDSKTLTVQSRPGAYLSGLVESLRATSKLSIDSVAISGVSIADTLRSVAGRDASALVMVRTQRSALSRIFFGSITDKLVGQLPIPLLVVPSSQDVGLGTLSAAERQLFTRPLAYLDESEAVVNLLKHTFVSPPNTTFLQLLRVHPLAELSGRGNRKYLPPSALRKEAWNDLLKAKHVLQRETVLCKPLLVFDGQNAASAIIDRAKIARADLIIMAGRPYLLPWWLRDGVVENVIRRASVPVLVVPEGNSIELTDKEISSERCSSLLRHDSDSNSHALSRRERSSGSFGTGNSGPNTRGSRRGETDCLAARHPPASGTGRPRDENLWAGRRSLAESRLGSAY